MGERPAVLSGNCTAEAFGGGFVKRLGRAETGRTQRQCKGKFEGTITLPWIILNPFRPPSDRLTIGGKADRPGRLSGATQGQWRTIRAHPAFAGLKVPDMDLVVVPATG